MNLQKLCLVFASSYLLTSCANISSDFKFNPDKPNGLVVGSVSYESGIGKYHLIAQGPGSTKPIHFGFGCSLIPCLEPANDDAFSASETPKQRGGGFAVEVPEGSYRIQSWLVIQGATYSRSRTPINIDFVVERGKVSYIGNLHFDAHWEDVKLRDKFSRDLPLLGDKYPVLKTTSFSYVMVPGTEIGKLGGAYQRGVEGPIFIPFVPLRR